MDRSAVAEFLRARRAALQPDDVGLPRGQRRRTPGLRREEVAALCSISPDYYSRLERGTSPQPSEQMVAALARGLRLTLDERDYLFMLIGYHAPARNLRGEHVSPGLMRILDRLDDTPAEILTELAATLFQTRLSVALFGNRTHHTGPARSLIYRWFTDPTARSLYAAADHHEHGRAYAAHLHHALARQGPGSPADELVQRLRAQSEEFAALWNEHEIGVTYTEPKRIIHPMVGELTLHCQTLHEPDQAQTLLVLTAAPGSEDYDKLELLSVVGAQLLDGMRIGS
jgi:transcriptional regulator with XRE-family HTH domain